jgi:hypothetical protein
MKYSKNINLFEQIDTEEKAYWLGLLMADGSIAWQKNKSGIKYYGIKLGLCDKELMDKYKKFFDIPEEFPYQILNQPNCQPVYYLYITCHKIAEDLVKHGMIKTKDYRTKVPKMPITLVRHFIRGYFDGDGCIYIRPKKLKNGISTVERFVSITSCSVKILKQIESILKKLKLIRLNKNHVKYPKTYKNKKHPPFLGFTHRTDVYNFLDFIYNNAIIYMDRKFNLYNSIKDNFLPPMGKSGRKKYFGIYFVKRNINKPYHVRFEFNGTKYRMGCYKTEMEAILAYNIKIKELCLPDWMLNKIEETAPIS